MLRRTLKWQLITFFSLILLGALSLVTWFSLQTLRNVFLDDARRSLMSHAATMQPLLSHGGGDLDLEELRKVVRQLGDRSDIRFTVIRPDGVVLADSDEDARVMDLHATRPEVRDALASGAGSDTRYSFTMQEPMMYAALYTAGGDKGESLVLRTAVSVAFIDESLNVILLRVGLIGLVVCVAAIGLSVWVARRISRPLENMTYAARRFARGEFAEKVHT